MSEPFNWSAMGLWSAGVSVQVGMAIRDAWKMWRQQRQPQPSTGYERVVSGERVDGWKIVIPKSALDKYSGWAFFGFVTPTWSINGGDLNNFSQYSQLLWFEELSNVADRVIFHLNRFSMLTPNADVQIMQVALDNNWKFCSAHQLTDRLIVIVFQNREQSLCCLCFFDIITRWYRMVKIEWPMRGGGANGRQLMVNVFDSPKSRLDVLFAVSSWRDQINGAKDLEFITASYEIPKIGHDETPIKAISWQSVAVPIGDRRNWAWNVVTCFPPAIHMYRDATDAHNVRSMSFRDGSWNVGSPHDWLESFRTTDFGVKWLNAVESFGALSPPNWALSPIQSLRHTPRISGFTIDGALFCLTNDGHILERSMAPHSLKRLAAQAFCKAFPNFNFAELKDVIGFDMFDGIFDGKEPTVIHL